MQSWTRCYIKIEAIKCFPCYIKVTFHKTVNDNNGSVLRINIPGLEIYPVSRFTISPKKKNCWVAPSSMPHSDFDNEITTIGAHSSAVLFSSSRGERQAESYRSVFTRTTKCVLRFVIPRRQLFYLSPTFHRRSAHFKALQLLFLLSPSHVFLDGKYPRLISDLYASVRSRGEINGEIPMKNLSDSSYQRVWFSQNHHIKQTFTVFNFV